MCEIEKNIIINKIVDEIANYIVENSHKTINYDIRILINNSKEDNEYLTSLLYELPISNLGYEIIINNRVQEIIAELRDQKINSLLYKKSTSEKN